MAVTNYRYDGPAAEQTPRRQHSRPIGAAVGWGTGVGIVAGFVANLCLAAGFGLAQGFREGDLELIPAAFFFIGFFGTFVAAIVGGLAGLLVGLLLAVFRAERHAPWFMAAGAGAFPAVFGFLTWTDEYLLADFTSADPAALRHLAVAMVATAGFALIGNLAGVRFADELSKTPR